MLLYDITFNSIPKIKYNCAPAIPLYRATIAKNDRLLELCLVESGEFVRDDGTLPLPCSEGHLYPLLFTEDSVIYSESGGKVRMRCVGVEADMSVRVIDSDALSEDDTRALMKNLLSGNRFLVSRDGFSVSEHDWIPQYPKKISSCFTGERIGEETRALSLFLDFMSRLTRAAMDEIAFGTHAFPTSAIAYSEMVVSYVIKNYRKKITVAEIAEEFGLTPNYLHAIFKQVKGVTIIEYLTGYRLELAKIYMERFGLRSYEAAALVGIDDPAYFSRIFKKHYGVSVSSYKNGK